MEKISSLIPRVLHRRGLKDEASASYITYLAMQWIAENLSVHKSKLVVSKHNCNVLFITSDHPIASQELSLVSQQLKEYLNSHEGIVVEDIVILRSRSTPN